MPERNDPCPCGSGKKYKKCCGPQASVISLVQTRYDRAYRTLMADLEEFCADFDENDADRARAQFHGTLELAEEVEEQQLYNFLDWFAFGYRTWTSGERLVSLFALNRPDPVEQELLAAWSESRPGIYTVEEYQRGHARLKDVLTDEEFRADLGPGRELAPGAVMLGRLLPVGETYRPGYDIAIGNGGLPDSLRDLAMVELERMRRAQPDATVSALYRERWPVIQDLFSLALMEQASGERVNLPQLAPQYSKGLSSPPPDATGAERMVGQYIAEYAEAIGFARCDAESMLRLWWDVVAALDPRVVKPQVWTAAVIYAWHRHAALHDQTQAEVAEFFQVSSPAVGSRYREIMGALALTDLDDRYVDPLDPVVRASRLMEAMPGRIAGDISDPIWLFGQEHPEALKAAQRANDGVQELLEAGEFEEARRRGHEALRHCPVYAPAWNNIAYSYFIEGNYQAAAKAASRALDTHPEYVYTLALLAEIYYRTARYKKSKEYLDQALTIYQGWMAKSPVWVRQERDSDRRRLWTCLATVGRHAELHQLSLAAEPAELDTYSLFQAAVAANQCGERALAKDWLKAAMAKAPDNLSFPALLSALEKVDQGILASFDMDYDFSVDSLELGAAHLTPTARAVLIQYVWGSDTEMAQGAVEVLASAKDPWARSLLKIVKDWTPLPEPVRKLARSLYNLAR